ncbi:MAG: NAD(P)-dependent alcohol dehydrogenase [Saprospiraceae bacterium]
MKAAIYTQYGPPDVIQLTNLSKPYPKDDELLIRVYASTVNRTDCGFRSAQYFVSRFFSGLFKPKHQTLGSEFAGIVEQIGSSVSAFKVGDKVFGYNDITFGGNAEYIIVHKNDHIEFIPEGIRFEQAAPITEGAHYALCNIRASGVKAGDHALVYGASGAIGSAAVQLLHYLGVHVTAVCNTKNVELLSFLGAGHVIDYQNEDFTKTKTKFSFIFDAVGKSSFAQCSPLLTNNGIYVSTELGKHGENVWKAVFHKLKKGKRILFPIPYMTKEIMTFLKNRVEDGSYLPVIDRQYDLVDIVEATKYVETGQKTGNVVLNVF